MNFLVIRRRFEVSPHRPFTSTNVSYKRSIKELTTSCSIDMPDEEALPDQSYYAPQENSGYGDNLPAAPDISATITK